LSIRALAPLIKGISSHVVKKNMLLPSKKPKRGLLGLGSTEDVIIRTLKIAGDEANLENDTTDIAHWVRVKSALAYKERYAQRKCLPRSDRSCFTPRFFSFFLI
jgi:hypothetical protein